METLEKMGEVISTDILVIGGSICGVLAALRAKEHGLNVVVVDKATVGWGGQGPMVGGGTIVLAPEDDKDDFYKWIVEFGEYLSDQDWLSVITNESYSTVKSFLDTEMHNTNGDEPFTAKVRDIDYKRSSAIFKFGNPVLFAKNKAKKMGVKMMDKIEIVELLKQDDRVVGAVGFNIIDGRFYTFKSKATIMAAGGCDFHHNRLFMSTGESIAMAYRAGAEMRNAEFCNAYAPGLKDYDIYAMGDITDYWYNSKGENVRFKYAPGKEDYRAFMLGVVKEVQEGRGPIYMDLSKMPEEDRDLVTFGFMAKGLKEAALSGKLPPPDFTKPKIMAKSWLAATYQKLGIDPFSVKLEAQPSMHGKLGPVRVNLDCATNVPGLWAIGDASFAGAGMCGSIGGQGRDQGFFHNLLFNQRFKGSTFRR